MSKNSNRGISTLVVIGIIAVLVVVVGGGYFGYQYISSQKNNNQQQNQNQNQKVQNQNNQNISQPTAPTFSFDISGKNLEIKNASGNLIQVIPLTNDARLSLNNSVGELVSFKEDINFDGYKDLAVVVAVPASNPESIDFYIYNPVTGKFDKDPVLKNLSGPSFNVAQKTISTYSSGGCAGRSREEDTFSFLNGKYVLTLKKMINCCSSDGNIRIEKLINGEMQNAGQEPCP